MSDDAIDSMEAGEPQMETGQWTVLPGGEEKDEEVGVGDDGGVMGAPNDDDVGGGGDSSAADGVITVEECLKQDYPLHYACWKGASLEVIKYLVEEADGDKGKELLGKADNDGNYPLHLACWKGASIKMIKYLIQKNPGPLQSKDKSGRTALDYIMDNNELKKLLGKADKDDRYPLQLALEGGASLDEIKSLLLELLVEADDAIQGKELLVLGGSVADKSSKIDRLNYLNYAEALAYAARQAEQPGTSLCVGLYGRWGGGKSTLWKLIKKFLNTGFLLEDVQLLDDVIQRFRKSNHPSFYRKAAIPFNNAVEKLASDPYVLNAEKKTWGEILKELKRNAAADDAKIPFNNADAERLAPLTFLEYLAWLFLRMCQSCRKEYELDNDDRNGNDVYIQRIQDARSRRMEMNAFFFSVFLVSLFPIWIVYWPIYLTCCKDREKNDDNIKEEVKQIVRIIKGDEPLGDGDSAHWDVAPCGTFFVIIFLQIVRAIVSGISLACAALHHVVCFQWCCGKINHTPTGAVKYKIVEFNAWTYQGSELLWASLMKELWDAVEAEFGKKAVRYHRAGIALAGENPYDESHRTLSPQQKARKRKRALLMFRARSYLYLFLFLSVLTVLLTLTIMNCEVVAANGINGTCLVKVVNVTNNATKNATAEAVNGTSNAADVVGLLVNITNDATEAVEAGGYEEGVLAAIIATVAAFCPLLASVITYCKKVLPYIRKTRGDFILEKASGSTKRKDFKEELGFMGEVKTELEYLFDLLTTETHLDKEIGCDRSLRLCVFIDDLDRCPKESVVSVLEAVILLLVDGPISVWLAIDSRIVVQCVEAVKHGVFDKANISGHEFLDKIVQLPFALPELTNDTKKSYLDKIIDEKELDPARVLARFMREGLDRKLLPLGFLWKLNEKEYHKKGPFFQLTRIATELDKRGHIIPRHDRKAVIGMTESELIKMVAENPQHASAEHQENLCLIISQAISQFIMNPQLEKSDEQKTPETDSKGSSSHIDGDTEANDETGESLEKEMNSAEQEARQVEDGNGKESGESPSDDINHSIPPPSGLYIPMLNEDERRCLEDFLSFIDGNPRRMKRIINEFNVSRRIAELRCGESNPVLPQLTLKILKMVILVEQWPYQMAWLLQLIEDIRQMSTLSVEDSRMNRFVEECFGRDKELRGKLCWDMICCVGILEVCRILEVYRRFVCELSMSNVDSSNMEIVDSDPQLFEGLLLCNGHDKQTSSEGPYSITVHDLRPLGCNMDGGEYETCLRSYMFNMPHAITDKVSIMMNKALINYAGKNSSNSGESEEFTGSEANDKSKIPGIQNLGDTCYLSASLQILYSIPQFLHDLYKSYAELSSTKDLPLTRALLEVAVTVGALKESDAPMISPDAARSTLLYSKAANPSALKEQMDVVTDKFVGYEQHDAHEFLGALVVSLHDELAAAAAAAAVVTTDLPTDEYFHLKVRVCRTCNSCGYSRSNDEVYRHLSVEVGGVGEAWGVERSLKQFFQAEDRELDCERCESGRIAKQTMKIISRPKAMLLHFKRFIVTQRDNSGMVIRKNESKILLKDSLSLSCFFSSEEERPNSLYHLCGVVHHVGNTANSGHYTTCAKRKLDEESAEASPNVEEQWVLFNDALGERRTINYVIGDKGNQKNCYMALYELKSFDCCDDEADVVDGYYDNFKSILRSFWL